MSKETAIILGVTGAFFGVAASASTLLVAAFNLRFGSRIIEYAPSPVFGISTFIVLGFGLIAPALSILGIAGGNIARTDMKKGGRLMLVSGIIGLDLFFWMWWIIPGALLTVGGILAIWDRD
ncbi:hypothetical protein SAMN04488587_1210 [Methanococcoides vulcani]|uniref:DUF4064 domain-containing protein n=1 Tax=Methanococcoides vulcani TaxID=1353158 RepID=A0A1H9ZRB9_9EURY|nr:hypothetical protein [Methanococcoides vulcani]SES84207.1 hypothetical protein SAMN04488587_1210 [Methanococcoides vulcani]